MRPYVICHMTASLDGRTLPSRWIPKTRNAGDIYERIHEKLDGDAWLVGRVTGADFSKRGAYDAPVSAPIPRENWIFVKDADQYAIIIDAHGKVAWGRSDIGGDPIVAVLSRSVSDRHLAGLRADKVSYIFAGETDADLNTALVALNHELGVKRLLVEGGGNINGGFLAAGLIDEISLILQPAIDGKPGAPALFETTDQSAAIKAIALLDCEPQPDGLIWMRYKVEY
jgi:riboflavin biosynthesis pyrimidine reductase